MLPLPAQAESDKTQAAVASFIANETVRNRRLGALNDNELSCNILFWDNPKTGLALSAPLIKSRRMTQKSVHSQAYKALREQLVAARRNADMTQEELAKRLKRPQSFVAKYEGGERRLDIVELLEIAAVLEIDVNKLIASLRRAL